MRGRRFILLVFLAAVLLGNPQTIFAETENTEASVETSGNATITVTKDGYVSSSLISINFP